MKSLNFMDTTPSCQEKEVQRWFVLSIIAIIMTIGGISYLHIKQISAYRALRLSCACCEKTDEDHAQLTKHIEELQVKEKDLQEKLTEFSKQKKIAEQTIARFNCMAKSCCAECHLESYSANDHDIQMTITAASAEHISQLRASLIASKAFNSLILVAMQPKESGYLFTIKDRC